MTDQPTSTANPRPQIVGERRLFYFNDNGQPAYQVYELTAADFLNAQPGDEFFHGEFHDRTARILSSMLHHHYRYSPTTSVHVKTKLVWPDPSLDQPMPDVVVVNHLSDPQRQRPIIDLAAEQAATLEGEVTIRAIFEITSPSLAEVDLEAKRTLYERAQIPEYWIVDSGLRPDNEVLRITVLGYQLQDESYQPILPKSKNRWESTACRLWITVDGTSIQLGDLRTGTPLPLPADDDNPAVSTQAEADRHAQSIADQLKL